MIILLPYLGFVGTTVVTVNYMCNIVQYRYGMYGVILNYIEDYKSIYKKHKWQSYVIVTVKIIIRLFYVPLSSMCMKC